MQRNKPKVHTLHKDLQSSSEDELWVLSFSEQVNAVSSDKGRINAAKEIGNKTVTMQIDTGASCNVLPVATCLPVLRSGKQSKNLLPTPSPN